MTEAQSTAFFNLVASIGVNAALTIVEAVAKPDATIEDAITALRAVKTADEYLAKAKAAAGK